MKSKSNQFLKRVQPYGKVCTVLTRIFIFTPQTCVTLTIVMIKNVFVKMLKVITSPRFSCIVKVRFNLPLYFFENLFFSKDIITENKKVPIIKKEGNKYLELQEEV